MSKKTWKEKKEEEKRVIEEMEAAMKEGRETQEQAETTSTQSTPPASSKGSPQKKGNGSSDVSRQSFYDSTMPQQIHCRQCRTLMENGVCPTCGYKMYVPMDPKKRDKIRLILAGILIAVFVVMFVAMEIARS